MEYEPVHCDECNGMAKPKDHLVLRADGTRWIHYDCENGQAFDQSLVGNRERCTCSEQ